MGGHICGNVYVNHRLFFSFWDHSRGRGRPHPYFPEDVEEFFLTVVWAELYAGTSWHGLAQEGCLNPTRDSGQFHFLSNILPEEKELRGIIETVGETAQLDSLNF